MGEKTARGCTGEKKGKDPGEEEWREERLAWEGCGHANME